MRRSLHVILTTLKCGFVTYKQGRRPALTVDISSMREQCELYPVAIRWVSAAESERSAFRLLSLAPQKLPLEAFYMYQTIHIMGI